MILLIAIYNYLLFMTIILIEIIVNKNYYHKSTKAEQNFHNQ